MSFRYIIDTDADCKLYVMNHPDFNRKILTTFHPDDLGRPAQLRACILLITGRTWSVPISVVPPDIRGFGWFVIRPNLTIDDFVQRTRP